MSGELEDLPPEALLPRLLRMVHAGSLTPEQAAEIFHRSKRESVPEAAA